MRQKLRVGIVGATGMVGQRFVTLLSDHPWYEISVLAASPNSAGKTYAEATAGRWAMPAPCSEKVAGMTVLNAADVDKISAMADFICCAVVMDKAETRALEEAYAKSETPVISNNSAHRLTPDVPMMLPEINPGHALLIDAQRERLGVKRGFIAVKPNCSIQSYVPALHPLMDYGVSQVAVCTYQAISGAGKGNTIAAMPDVEDNVIPYIGDEEEKSEIEPLRIWGRVNRDHVEMAGAPVISAQCVRVPISDGHLAAVFVSFDKKPTEEEIINAWAGFKGEPQIYGLPSAPGQLITYMREKDRPQPRLDRDLWHGMGITVGRLRGDNAFDYRFISLSHNTLRGAAGGAVLMAELLTHKGYITAK